MSIPESLVNELVHGGLVPFVGSGASLSVKPGLFPTWPGLLGSMAERLDQNAKPKEALLVRTYVEMDRLYDAAEEALRGLGKSRFFALMRDRFQVDRPDDADLSLIDAIWRLEPPLVVTTNYENVLQWAAPQATQVLNSQKPELAELYRARAATPDRPKIWHLHGHVDQAESLILAPVQYDAFYGDAPQTKRDYQAALTQLNALVANYSLLLIGFGLNDRYVLQLLDGVLEAFGGNLRPSYALIKAGESDTNRLWEKHNIQPIEFADYGPPLVDRLSDMASRMNQARTSVTPDGGPAPGGRGKPVIPPTYLDALRKECGAVDLLGMRITEGHAVRLNHVYVPLTTPSTQIDQPPARRRPELPTEDRERVQLLLELLGQQSLYVSGAPGSGKSTFCRWVAWLACDGQVQPHAIAPPEQFQESFPDSLRGRLPLLVRLRDFWNHLPPTPGSDTLTWSEFEAVLAEWVESKNIEGLSWPLLEDHLKQGSVLLVADGVDEVPLSAGPSSNPYQPRKMIHAGLAAAARRWTACGNRVLVTSRPYGLTDAQQHQLGFRHAPLSDLSDPIQQLLVRRWLHCLVDAPEDADSRAADMLGHVRGRPEIAPLAANPMLLTAMCIVFQEGKRLPQDKYDLYHRITETVLCNRYPDDPAHVDVVRNRLAVVAYGMHTGYGLGEPRTTPRAAATHDEIDRMIRRYQDQSPGTERRFVSAVQTRDDLLGRSGILLPRDDDQAAFYHFTFQDFLAAQLILDLERDRLRDAFCQRAEVPEWRNTLSFVYSSLLAKSTDRARSIRLLSDLIDRLTPDTVRLAVTVADCFEILWGRGTGLEPEQEEAFRRYCVDAIEREVPLKQRYDLGLALGRLGDPRVPKDARDPNGRVEIPAGTYGVGKDKEKYVLGKPFWICRFPVTNAQFRLFVDAGGYEDRQCWSNEGWEWREREQASEPRWWRDGKWNGPTQPVVGVSFWEAEAFATWAGGRLPSEREWEAAARGPDALMYPWGEDIEKGICNSSDADLGATSPVALFPRSKSKAFGLHDMAGNVWEWCSDFYDREQYETARVLRGGAWVNPASVCRAAVRNRYRPDFRLSYVGFRVLFLRQNSP